MKQIIETQCSHHLGDNIINFIFFYKLKDYIESNDIIIHYYCHSQYHKNLIEFKCSENIVINNYENRGYVLWQGALPHNTFHCIEDKLCFIFETFTQKFNIPVKIDRFEYQDPDLFERYNSLEEKYKNIDILIINSSPCSGQYKYHKTSWDNFAISLSDKYKIATSQKIDHKNIISLEDMSVKNIAAIALKVRKIIAINTGPSIPLYNTDILDSVDAIYIFGERNLKKTRKFICANHLNEVHL